MILGSNRATTAERESFLYARGRRQAKAIDAGAGVLSAFFFFVVDALWGFGEFEPQVIRPAADEIDRRLLVVVPVRLLSPTRRPGTLWSFSQSRDLMLGADDEVVVARFARRALPINRKLVQVDLVFQGDSTQKESKFHLRVNPLEHARWNCRFFSI